MKRFGSQPCNLAPQADQFRVTFRIVRIGALRIDVEQQLPLLDHVTFPHVHVGKNAAFERLNDLLTADGNHFPLPLRDFLHTGELRPYEPADQNRGNQIQHDQRARDGLRQRRLAQVIHVSGVGRMHARRGILAAASRRQPADPTAQFSE